MDDINKKIKRCEKLGALKFQKLVFLVEKIKYKVIDKFFPDLEKWYNKQCDKKIEILLKKCKNENEKRTIIEVYRIEKLKFKKEINQKENRNYHVDLNDPNAFKKYLDFNKNIHVKGLKSNIIFSSIIILLSIIFSYPFPLLLGVLLGYQGICAIVNFECINLQNYNLYRFEEEKMQKVIKRLEEKNAKEIDEKMIDGMKVIGTTFRKTDYIPTKDEVIKEITTNEEKLQLLYYVRKRLKSIQNINEPNKVMIKKGRV